MLEPQALDSTVFEIPSGENITTEDILSDSNTFTNQSSLDRHHL